MDRNWTQVAASIVEDRRTPCFRFRVQGQSMLPTLLPGDQIVVERIPSGRLCPGDLVLVQNGEQLLLHRFLGIRERGGRRFLLTGGDHSRCPDPLCPEEALVGRAVAAFRGDRTIRLPLGRWQAWRHRVRMAFWTAWRHTRILLPLLMVWLALSAGAGRVRASVTLVSFEAGWAQENVRVTWETASEVDNMGFYVLRSQQQDGPFERITDLIPAEGDIVGASYEWLDGEVTPGEVYYYKLEDVSASGGSNFWGPVSTAGELTPTPSVTPTPTSTATPTPSPTATATPTPSPTATATPTPSATFTVTATPSPSPTQTSSPMPTATASLTPTGRPSVTPASTATRVRPSSTSSSTLEPTSIPLPTAGGSAQTATSSPSPSPTVPASPTPTYAPPSPPQPSPPASRVEVVAEHSEGAEPPMGEEPISEEEQARAKRRLTWSLIGIGGAVFGALLLVALALATFALYQWGYLRRE